VHPGVEGDILATSLTMKAMTKFVEGTRQYVNIQCDDEIVRDFGSTPLWHFLALGGRGSCVSKQVKQRVVSRREQS
jgi:hypothetical protein